MALRSEEAPFGVPAARASQPTRMDMTLQPERAQAVIQ
jgi:hypothetical protein